MRHLYEELQFISGLIVRSIALTWKGKMGYKTAFTMATVCQAFSYASEFLVIGVVVTRFRDIRGWTAWEVVFLYAMNLISYGLGASFTYGLSRRISSEIVSGGWDAYMCRPISPLIYYMSTHFGVEYVSHCILSTLMLCVSSVKLGLKWTIGSLASLAIMITGGAVIQGTLLLIPSLASFWIRHSASLVELLFGLPRRFIEYPISIFPSPIRWILTFVIPVAFVSYYPGHLFLRKGVASGFPAIMIYICPAVATVLASLALVLANLSIRRYQSTGS